MYQKVLIVTSNVLFLSFQMYFLVLILESFNWMVVEGR